MIKFEKHFLDSTTDTQSLLLNTTLRYKLFCNKAYLNLYFMVIWFINSNELLENLILVINSKRL